ncbi:hypothetical protein ACFLT3_00150 [Chloroflexota bacterium]
MKKRLAIAVVLALVMLVTLATPVLAAKPVKSIMADFTVADLIVGKCSLQVTHNNELKVTTSLKGADSGDYDAYWLSASYNNPDGISTNGYLGVLTINSRGSGRLSVIDDASFSTGDWGIRIFIYEGPGMTGLKYYNIDPEIIWVTFE